MKSHIKFAISSLKKNLTYTLINLGGLSFGMGVALALTLAMMGVKGMDQFHENKDSVFKLIHKEDSTANDFSDASSALLAPTIKNEIPEVVDYCHYFWANDKILGSPENYVKENGFYASEGWFRMLTFPLVYGNKDHALSKPDYIVISEKLCNKLFGKANPVGKTIRLYSFETSQPEMFTISGVFKDVGEISSLKFEFVIPFAHLTNQNQQLLSWTRIGTRSYIQMKPGSDPEKLIQKINELIHSKHTEERKVYGLAPLHKSNQIFYTLSGKPSVGYFMFIAFGIFGFSVLLISIINYINLSVATALSRSKEIGMKKLHGAGRVDLIVQFFIEAFIVLAVAGIFAIVIHAIILSKLMAQSVPLLAFVNLESVRVCIVLLVLTLIFTTWYPAVYLSRFSPLYLQKAKSMSSKLSFSRKFLVAFQFFSAIILITTSIILARQVDFIFNKSMGMDRYGVVFFTKNKQLDERREAFVQDLNLKPGIISVTFADQLPFMVGNATTSISWEGKDSQSEDWLVIMQAGEDFAKTMDIKLLQGRDFSWNNQNKIIVNKAAVDLIHLENPVGSNILWGGESKEIIGVVENFNHQALGNPNTPIFIGYAPERSSYGLVRLKKGEEIVGLKSLKESYSNFSPDFILDYTFLDHFFDNNFSMFNKMKETIGIAGFLAVIIACLGLLGLTVHASERRMKELGVRKINGAGIMNLIKLLSSTILKSILIAAVFAYPLVFLINTAILQNFAERIEINAWHMIGSLAIMLGLIMLTVGWQVVITATRNPIEALRYE